ncbi:MAG TPA: DUF4349 domain-containing protein [Candidatus Limnocylindria bacterium]
MRHRTALILLVLAAIIGTACSSAFQSSTTSSSAGGAPVAAPAARDVGQKDQAAGNGATTPQNGIPSFANAGRDLILTASVTFRSADPWATADQARAIAAGLGGDLLALSQTGSGDQKNALLTIRVPSDRFDSALSQLKKLDGEVLTSNVNAQDVTDQFVDVQARLDAQKAQEQQYLAILARANTVDEILKVQSALSSTRMQIEQLQGQVNSMKSRIDYSTITMSITPTVTIASEPAGRWDPARTFAQALAALTALFRVLGDAAIWLLVLGWIPVIALALFFFALRKTRATRAAAA